MAGKGQERGVQHLDALQHLRGLAAMLVVYFHAVVQVDGRTGSTPLPMIGESGVDIFFVLSGFVMWWTTRGREPSAADFLRKRLIRIAPLYWLFTLAAATIAFVAPQLLRSTVFDPFHLAMSLLFVPAWNPAFPRDYAEAISPALIPGWTLNLEIVFYVMFAIALKVREAVRLWIVAALMLALFVTAGALSSESPFRFYATDLWAEFIAGVVLAMTIDRVPVIRPGIWAATFLIAFAALLTFDYLQPPFPRSVFLGVPALLCVAAALQAERGRRGRLPGSAALSLLGDASYSIYLSHIFVLPAARLAFGLVGIDVAVAAGAVFVTVAMITAAAGGIVIHLAVERPLLAAVNSVARHGRRPPGAAEFAER